MDIGNKLVVYEYQETINNEKRHYIGIGDISNKNVKKIMTNNNEIVNSDMYFPSISKDDRYITFTSRATNITEDAASKCYDMGDDVYLNCSNIYLYDINEGISYLLKNGNEILDGDSYISKISGDGKSVVFESIATNNLNLGNMETCINNGRNICINIYKYNIASSTIKLLSTLNDNYGGNYNSVSPSISYDGRYVAFQSSSTNLVNNKFSKDNCKNVAENGDKLCSYIYLVDTKDNTIKIISKNKNILFNDSSGNAIVSGNGKFVVYESYATNIENKTNNNLHIVLYDILADTNFVISKKDYVLNNRDTILMDISNDGKYIVCMSNSTNLDGRGKNSIYVYNSVNKKVSLLKQDVSKSFLAFIRENNIYYYENLIIGYEKIDDIAPVIKENQEIYVLKDSNVFLKDKIEISDNLSDIKEIDVYMVDNLIFNTIGEYLVQIIAVDGFGNKSSQMIKIVVVEKDEEGPIFSDIDEIKILKGSSTLNLSNYIEAIDKIDGNARVYILNDDNLDLNNVGKYKIKLMAKDSFENVTYKDLYIVVYENYNFEYYYEILLIIGLIAVIIFSIIKVK
jgi:hypothetical protein